MYIESKVNDRVKNIVKLRDKSAREKNGLFFFEGAHMLEEYLRYGHTPDSVFVCEKSLDEYALVTAGIEKSRLFTVSESVFAKLSTEKSPRGILTISAFLTNNVVFIDKEPDYKKLTENNDNSFIFLDSLRDNGNVGTIIRTAAALGGVSCVLSSDCADVYSYKTIRATMGTLFSSRIYITGDLSKAILSVKNSGRRVFASTLGKNSLLLDKIELKEGDSFVVGNEGQGVSERIYKVCDGAVKIPITDAAESLNASAAAAILLWHIRKLK